MILVDRALQRRAEAGDPVRVAMVGAGFMGRGIARQIVRAVPGMSLVGIANRSVDAAERAYTEAGAGDVTRADSPAQVEAAVAAGRPVVTDDPLLLCRAERVDAVVEVTGTVEHAAVVVTAAIDAGKHVVAMNAELDGTVGSILKRRADAAGVVFTNADGDQPGVIANLYRFVRGIGVEPVLCGNIKGLHDPYRTPTTQREFAERWGQQPSMVTSFADGSKISFEQAIVANATGMRVGRRGMFGPTVPSGTPLEQSLDGLPLDRLQAGERLVDYVVGAMPSPGVFVLGMHDDPVQQHYLNLYKLGTGPFYCFYTPYHLCHFEVPTTVARAVLFGDATIASAGTPSVEVVATAKTALRAGQVVDGIGGYLTYGLCENADVAAAQGLLPLGLAEGCTLVRDVPIDAVMTRADVRLPPGRMCDTLRAEQDEASGLPGAVGSREGGA